MSIAPMLTHGMIRSAIDLMTLACLGLLNFVRRASICFFVSSFIFRLMVLVMRVAILFA